MRKRNKDDKPSETTGEKTTGKKNKNDWYLANLGDVSKAIYEIGKKVRNDGFEALAPNQYKNRAGLVKLVYLDYQGGFRIGELIRPPMPKVELTEYQGRTIIKITKQNEKHFTDSSKSTRQTMIVQIVLEDQYDKLMWDYIFDDGANINLDFLMAFQCSSGLNQEDYNRHRKQISNLIEYNFRTDLADGTTDKDGKPKIYKEAGIIPHIFRHLRTYNLLINKGHNERYVQTFFGWSAKEQVERYLYIKNKLKEIDQLQLLSTHFNYLDQTRRPRFKIGRETADEVTS